GGRPDRGRAPRAAGERRPRAPDDRPRRGGVAAADRLPLSRCVAPRDHHRPRGHPAGGARSARPHRGALAVSAVAVVGSVAFDDIETPAGRAEHLLGGLATHFVVAASFFAPVPLSWVVGGVSPAAQRDYIAARVNRPSWRQWPPG